MTNVLNNIIAKQSLMPANSKAKLPSFTFDSDGKVKPLDDKAKLLPSRIFGSPIEYVKDLKQDVVNIGRAATGKANDHELGRINDVAMKLGSLGLAAYLAVKNPLKLNKTMEFVGLGTFFASMALWPKLAIQAPLKARTGVDIHQKYLDSQGRKKMLHQDPQYDLTDLYSRKDLDKMGNKLDVSENLPDRDSFIKQRAKKVATQGNTLWMMTAGIATPVMSALACNRLEKPINKMYEVIGLKSTAKALENGTLSATAQSSQNAAAKAFDKFLEKNADAPLDENMAKRLAVALGFNSNSASMQDAIKEQLSTIKNNVEINEAFVREVVGDEVVSALSEESKTVLNEALESKSIKGIAKALGLASAETGASKKQIQASIKQFENMLDTAKKAKEMPTIAQASDKIKSLYVALDGFRTDKKLLDNFMTERVGKKSGTYIANQWGRVCESLFKSLKLKGSELDALRSGNMDVLEDKLSELAKNPKEYDEAVTKLMKLIGQYEDETGETFLETIKTKTTQMSDNAAAILREAGFDKIADKFSSTASRGSVKNNIDNLATERAQGAKSSFYRLIQTLDLYKRINDKTFETQLKEALTACGKEYDKELVDELIQHCKKIMLDATTTDHVEKLQSLGFELSGKEYKAVLGAVFGEHAGETIKQSLKNNVGTEQAETMFSGFRGYIDDFVEKVANWKNGMKPDFGRYVLNGESFSANAIERNNLVAKPIKDLVQDVAKQTYNSKKWLKIFGGTAAVLTTVTLLATLAIGRKPKIEKQLEEEGKKVNG